MRIRLQQKGLAKNGLPRELQPIPAASLTKTFGHFLAEISCSACYEGHLPELVIHCAAVVAGWGGMHALWSSRKDSGIQASAVRWAAATCFSLVDEKYLATSAQIYDQRWSDAVQSGHHAIEAKSAPHAAATGQRCVHLSSQLSFMSCVYCAVATPELQSSPTPFQSQPWLSTPCLTRKC